MAPSAAVCTQASPILTLQFLRCSNSTFHTPHPKSPASPGAAANCLPLLRWEEGKGGLAKMAAMAAAAAGLALHHRKPAGQGAAGPSAVAAPSAVVCMQASPMLPLQ